MRILLISFLDYQKKINKFHQFNIQEPPIKNRDNNINNYFVMPYIGFASEKFVRFFKNINNFHLTFYGINKLNSIIKVHKDILPTLSHSNVVYKIRCLQCSTSYVGQTHRLLKIRIEEHRSHIRRNTGQNSVITEHHLKYAHDFDWDNVEILDEELHFNERLISEMIHIKKQSNSLNLQQDTELLNPIYFDIV